MHNTQAKMYIKIKSSDAEYLKKKMPSNYKCHNSAIVVFLNPALAVIFQEFSKTVFISCRPGYCRLIRYLRTAAVIRKTTHRLTEHPFNSLMFYLIVYDSKDL